MYFLVTLSFDNGNRGVQGEYFQAQNDADAIRQAVHYHGLNGAGEGFAIVEQAVYPGIKIKYEIYA